MLSLSPRVAIVGACLCSALGTILSKTLHSSFPPVTILVFQLTPSVIALWLAVVFTKPDFPAARLLVPIGLLGLLNPGWAYTFNMFGLAETSASIATLLWAFEPILIRGLAWIFLRERIDYQLAGLVQQFFSQGCYTMHLPIGCICMRSGQCPRALPAASSTSSRCLGYAGRSLFWANVWRHQSGWESS
jgi:hypothetical protein